MWVRMHTHAHTCNRTHAHMQRHTQVCVRLQPAAKGFPAKVSILRLRKRRRYKTCSRDVIRFLPTESMFSSAPPRSAVVAQHVYHCVSVAQHVYHCVSVSQHVYHCVSVSQHVYHCVSMCILVSAPVLVYMFPCKCVYVCVCVHARICVYVFIAHACAHTVAHECKHPQGDAYVACQ
jgi:hypothetical protein